MVYLNIIWIILDQGRIIICDYRRAFLSRYTLLQGHTITHDVALRI